MCEIVIWLVDISAPKKIFSPPPKIPNSPQTPSRPLGPFPSWRPPPLWDFQLKIDPPPSRRPRTPPFPLPEGKKIKNIRNVRQGEFLRGFAAFLFTRLEVRTCLLNIESFADNFVLAFAYFARSPENFCGFFFEFAWRFCIEKWRGFLINFFMVSVSHETKHENSWKNSGTIRSKIRGKIRDENSKNSGNFRSATFLT